MEKLNQIYRCAICGIIMETVHAGQDELMCCGRQMEALEEKKQDPALGEKHVPVIERDGGVIKVKVGSVPHPMIDTHYIEWIELIDPGTNDVVMRRYLHPGDAPELTINEKDCPMLAQKIGNLVLREYCNIHLLWANK
ncbi:MAG: desulfoferrodoxin family protein [Candidatus Pacebacteria bacterium]|nr:desulfoferrodoxin family protein [Candidatus Paceibacterota bacterium]